MEGFDAEGFVREWVRAWNARDLDAVVGHFTEDAEFFSPRAEEVTGNPAVVIMLVTRQPERDLSARLWPRRH